MKDEEMAEESFEQYRTKDIDYVVSPYSEDNGTQKLMFNNEYDAEEEYFRFYKQGFLAGLKAGRPQWNYMKDVNCYEDLPHNEDVYYAYVVNVGAYDKPTIERKLGSFAEFEFDVMAYHVIAWCEIPTFDKE